MGGVGFDLVWFTYFFLVARLGREAMSWWVVVLLLGLEVWSVFGEDGSKAELG